MAGGKVNIPTADFRKEFPTASHQMILPNLPRHPWDERGSEVGPGWKPIVWKVMEIFELAGAKLHQVKEKFGALRIYYGFGTDIPLWHRIACDMAVRQAETASHHICEDCGDVGSTKNCSGWYRTLCIKCLEEFQTYRKTGR